MDSWSQVDKLEGNVGQALGNVILPGVIKLAAPLPLPAIGAGEKRDPAGVLDGASGDRVAKKPLPDATETPRHE